ncbi:MAG: hypothetical protein MK102_15470 [Fuerstiella sp.]|nr:hypothetical protein [Fuerstiella sp.]
MESNSHLESEKAVRPRDTHVRECPMVVELITALNRSSVTWCHWKSNDALASALSGSGDLDLLVARESLHNFDATLAELGFRLVLGAGWQTHPSIQHYYGYDDASGQIIHLHVYYRLVTAGSMVKGYRLPLERMIFDNLRSIGDVPVPTKGCELLVLTLRKMLEFGTLSEMVFMLKEYSHVHKEFTWLNETDAIDEAKALCREWLPRLDLKLFESALTALGAKHSFPRLAWLGRRFHASLRGYRITTSSGRFVRGIWRFVQFAIRRFVDRGRGLKPLSGGAVVAFVGGDGSGKSTLLSESRRWLRDYFSLRTVHVGKPPSTWVSLLPNLLLPLARVCFPATRTNTVEYHRFALNDETAAMRQRSLLYTLRSAMIAYDQWSLLRRCSRRAARGMVVLCDRYPATNMGGMDGPRLNPDVFGDKPSLRRWIARLEQRLYANMPKPDVILFVTVPPDVAVQRNAIRDKRGPRESEESIRFRHERMADYDVANARVVRIDSSQPLDATVVAVKNEIWKII